MAFTLRNITFNTATPYAYMSRGEAIIAALQVNQQARANLHARRGNGNMQQVYQQEADTLAAVLANGLHTSNNGTLNNITSGGTRFGSVIRRARRLTRSATKKDNNVGFTQVQNGIRSFSPNLPFDPTPEQLQECRDYARREIQARYPNDWDVALAGENGPGNEAIRAEFSRIANDCIKGIPYQNMLNEHVEQAGAVALYSLFNPRDTRFNNPVGNKRDSGNRWIDGVVRVTGLPREVIETTIDTSIVNQLGVEWQEVQARYGPYLAKGNQARNIISTNNEVFAPAPTDPNTGNAVPDIQIPDSLFALATTVVAYIATINVGVASALAILLGAARLFGLFKSGNDDIRRREERIETFFELTPGQIIPECDDLNGIRANCILPDGSGCLDANGNQVECPPEAEEQSSNNTGLIIGLGAGALALFWALSRRNNTAQDG